MPVKKISVNSEKPNRGGRGLELVRYLSTGRTISRELAAFAAVSRVGYPRYTSIVGDGAPILVRQCGSVLLYKNYAGGAVAGGVMRQVSADTKPNDILQ